MKKQEFRGRAENCILKKRARRCFSETCHEISAGYVVDDYSVTKKVELDSSPVRKEVLFSEKEAMVAVLSEKKS